MSVGKNNISNLAKMLSQLRKKNGLRQADVAELLNVCRSTYSYYESGKTEPSFNTLCKLATIFGVDVQDFSTLESTSITLRDSDAASSHTQKSNAKTPKTMRDLSTEERKLIAAFRMSNPKNKRKMYSALTEDNKK